jgi:hypothetical protein
VCSAGASDHWWQTQGRRNNLKSLSQAFSDHINANCVIYSQLALLTLKVYIEQLTDPHLQPANSRYIQKIHHGNYISRNQENCLTLLDLQKYGKNLKPENHFLSSVFLFIIVTQHQP